MGMVFIALGEAMYPVKYDLPTSTAVELKEKCQKCCFMSNGWCKNDSTYGCRERNREDKHEVYFEKIEFLSKSIHDKEKEEGE